MLPLAAIRTLGSSCSNIWAPWASATSSALLGARETQQRTRTAAASSAPHRSIVSSTSSSTSSSAAAAAEATVDGGSSGTKPLSLVNAVNEALHIAMESDETAGELCFDGWRWVRSTHRWIAVRRSASQSNQAS
jgi:hypothetical protein